MLYLQQLWMRLFCVYDVRSTIGVLILARTKISTCHQVSLQNDMSSVTFTVCQGWNEGASCQNMSVSLCNERGASTTHVHSLFG
jgi:hypothetical protein